MPVLALIAIAGAGIGLGGWGLASAFDSIDAVVVDSYPLLAIGVIGTLVVGGYMLTKGAK